MSEALGANHMRGPCVSFGTWRFSHRTGPKVFAAKSRYYCPNRSRYALIVIKTWIPTSCWTYKSIHWSYEALIWKNRRRKHLFFIPFWCNNHVIICIKNFGNSQNPLKMTQTPGNGLSASTLQLLRPWKLSLSVYLVKKKYDDSTLKLAPPLFLAGMHCTGEGLF